MANRASDFLIRLVSFGEAAERTIVHDRKLILLSEKQGGTPFTNQRKEVPQTERVADFMAKRLQLLLLCLAKENRMNVTSYAGPPSGKKAKASTHPLGSQSSEVL